MTDAIEHALNQVDWESRPDLSDLLASDEAARAAAQAFNR